MKGFIITNYVSKEIMLTLDSLYKQIIMLVQENIIIVFSYALV